MSKTNPIAVIVISDPTPGTDEALGRVFNALAVAHDSKTRGEHVEIYFQGTGTRWPGVLSQDNHPANELYKAVQACIVGASCGCADVFGAQDSLTASGTAKISENYVPGTSGLPSISRLVSEGYQVVTF